jgi:acyl-CoA synthetase (NDP forming)
MSENKEQNLKDFLDILRIAPRGVALFGESEKRGFYWVKSLMGVNYKGAIVPINPTIRSAAGIPCYPTLDEAPAIPIDFAIIAVSKKHVIDCLQQCIAHDVKVSGMVTSKPATGCACSDRIVWGSTIQRTVWPSAAT